MKLVKAVLVEQDPSVAVTYDCAVCIHVFYVDVFRIMIPFLQNLPQSSDLFITLRSELQLEVAALLAGAGLKARWLIVENIGMDVLPFITAISEFGLDRYNTVLKLHTKNNASDLGRAHLDIFLKTLLATSDHVLSIIDAFKLNHSLLMVGPDDLYRSAHFMMYNNRNVVREICRFLHIPSERIDWGFFAGTMFWIRGAALKPLLNAVDPLYDLAKAQIGDNERTGRDGTVAHGLERIWGALAPSEGKQIGLVRPINCDLSLFEIRIGSDYSLLEEKIRRIGASDVLPRWSTAPHTTSILNQHGAVDVDYYRKTGAAENIGNMDPTLHYALYGELWGVDPSENFSTVYYRLQRPDVVRKHANVLGHYYTHGVREGIAGSPTETDWLNLAASLQLFNDNWYRKENAAIELSDLDSHEYHRLIGKSVLLPTSQNFAPKAIPLLALHNDAGDPLVNFIKLYYLPESRAYDELARVLQNNDYELVPYLVDELVSNYGVTAALVGALALTHVRRGEWLDARELLENYWAALKARNLPIRHRRSVNPQSQIGNEVFEVVKPQTRRQRDISVLVYTTLFGDIDTLPPDLFCF